MQFDLNGLINAVKMGQIALPEIQREFIWKNTKVRDLFDPMYHGYPVGYLLSWQNDPGGTHRVIGDEKQVRPQLLVVDGRQWQACRHRSRLIPECGQDAVIADVPH